MYAKLTKHEPKKSRIYEKSSHSPYEKNMNPLKLNKIQHIKTFQQGTELQGGPPWFFKNFYFNTNKIINFIDSYVNILIGPPKI